MVVAVLGVVGGVGVGVGVRVGVGAAAAVVEVEVAAAAGNRIGLSYWHLLWRGWVRAWIGYGTGMDRDTLSGPAFPLWL